MSLKHDIISVLLGNAAKALADGLMGHDLEKEIIRINSIRFPEFEFCVCKIKHNKTKQLVANGWREALVHPDIAPGIFFPQECLGKYVLLCKRNEPQKQVGFGRKQ